MKNTLEYKIKNDRSAEYPTRLADMPAMSNNDRKNVDEDPKNRKNVRKDRADLLPVGHFSTKCPNCQDKKDKNDKNT